MTAIRQWTIICDGDNAECEAILDISENTAFVTRSAANLQGWTQRGSQDFCPTHSVRTARFKKCCSCGQHTPDVRRRLCIYQLEINEERHWHTICDDCEQEHADAV